MFLVEKSRTVAQLRLLLVDPKARGLGVGARLVDECARFARQTGYRKIVLWTHSILRAACHIYEKAGYRLLSEERHKSFGPEVVGQNSSDVLYGYNNSGSGNDGAVDDVYANQGPTANLRARQRLRRRYRLLRR